AYYVVIFQDADLFRRDLGKFSPETLHLVAVETGGGSDQFRRIDEMRRAPRMDINRRAQFGEAPRGAGVIEMDVAEKNVTNVTRLSAELGERGSEVVEGRFRASIEKNRTFVGL